MRLLKPNKSNPTHVESVDAYPTASPCAFLIPQISLLDEVKKVEQNQHTGSLQEFCLVASLQKVIILYWINVATS